MRTINNPSFIIILVLTLNLNLVLNLTQQKETPQIEGLFIWRVFEKYFTVVSLYGFHK
jgi:hypothetical protein